jgi:hypothetical protein
MLVAPLNTFWLTMHFLQINQQCLPFWLFIYCETMHLGYGDEWNLAKVKQFLVSNVLKINFSWSKDPFGGVWIKCFNAMSSIWRPCLYDCNNSPSMVAQLVTWISKKNFIRIYVPFHGIKLRKQCFMCRCYNLVNRYIQFHLTRCLSLTS